MKNEFNIIIPAYNVGEWIGLNLETLKLQSYENFNCVIIDDKSTDNSVDVIKDIIKNDNRFNLIVNEKRVGSSLRNYIKGFDYLCPNDEDVVVWIDGDDWLSSVFVLEHLNNLYNRYNCWMTYGTYQSYPEGRKYIKGGDDIKLDDIGKKRRIHDWYKKAHKFSHKNVYNLFNQYRQYTWRDVFKDRND